MSKLQKKKNGYGQMEYEVEVKLGETTIYLIYMPSSDSIDIPTFESWLQELQWKDPDELADKIWHTVMGEISPMFISVQVTRGGLKVNKPAIYAPNYDPACYGVK